VSFLNKFPSLRPNPPHPALEGTGLYPVDEAKGVCEVVVKEGGGSAPASAAAE